MGNGAEFYLPLFGSTGTDFPVTTFFAGGPVWAMDWLPVKDVTDEQFVALSAYAELDEVLFNVIQMVYAASTNPHTHAHSDTQQKASFLTKDSFSYGVWVFLKTIKIVVTPVCQNSV